MHLTHACTTGVGAAIRDVILSYSTQEIAGGGTVDLGTNVSCAHHAVLRHSDLQDAADEMALPIFVL